MKKHFLIIAVLLLSFAPFTDKPVDRLGVPGPLKFSLGTFHLSWTDKPRDNYYIQEYLPTGETTDHYVQMLTLHLFLTNMSIEEALAVKTAELDKRKETDGTCHYQIDKSPDGKEYIIDFLLGESKNDKMTITELNVYRYTQIQVGTKDAILVYAYTFRAYGDDITAFLHNLRYMRTQYINDMIKVKVPAVKLMAE